MVKECSTISFPRSLRVSPTIFPFCAPLLMYACTVLVIYEYLITLGPEVRLFWRREITGASILFFVNRYVVLFYNLFILAGYSSFNNTRSVSTVSAFASRFVSHRIHRRMPSVRVDVGTLLTSGHWMLDADDTWMHSKYFLFCATFLGRVIAFYGAVFSGNFIELTLSQGFSALRVFALTGRNWFIGPTVFILSLGPVAINFVRYAAHPYAVIHPRS